jgi:membrane associated rhomboid family serine protease
LIPLKDNIPTRRFPVLTVALIAINVFVFVFLQHGGHIGFGAPNDNNLVRWGLIPYEITHSGKECVLVAGGQIGCGSAKAAERVSGQSQPNTWVTLISSIFMHGGLLHIAGNMLFLWIFGNNIEDSMSRWRFAVFYLLGGIVANFAQIAVGPNSTAPGIGASGAIAAVLGGYALLYPRARVITAVILIFFITLLDLPALLVLGAWFVLQILDAALNSPLGGGVAYFAHIGGFAFGLLLIKLFANRVNTEYDRVNRLPVY